MGRLLRSFYYKLFRDITFKIVAIIGAVLSVLLALIYGFLIKGPMCSGAYGLISSISPSQNFGLAIPINLSIFIVLLFSQGIIRNEIIVGNSKTKVYFSLLIGGITFSLLLITLYVAINIGVLSLINGGFYNEYINATYISSGDIIKIIVVALINYTLISTYVVFISTSLRNVGGTISLVLIPVVMLSIVSLIIVLMSGELLKQMSSVPEWLINLNKYGNPQYMIGKISGVTSLLSGGSGTKSFISDKDFIISLVNNCAYIVIFASLGLLAFNKKDLK